MRPSKLTSLAIGTVMALALAGPDFASAADLSFSFDGKGGTKGKPGDGTDDGGGGGGGGKGGGKGGGGGGTGGGGTGGGGGTTYDLVIVPGGRSPAYYSWMSGGLPNAWTQATGLGARITVVDDFNSSNVVYGDYGAGLMVGTHGDWTSMMASLVAPGAEIAMHEFAGGQAVELTTGFDVINASYGMMGAPGQGAIAWDAQEQSIIDYAWNGDALIAKAAGNDAVAMGSVNANGDMDYLAADLAGASAAVFVGASSVNGYGQLAWYSNYAGTDAAYNTRFVYVGVEDYKTLLAGTSFAAPIVAGYAAIIGEKYDTTDAVVVADQILTTARRDFAGYDINVHGMGEASIGRALAPASIN